MPKLDSVTGRRSHGSLSRRGDDMRITNTRRVAGRWIKMRAKTAPRSLTAFGDDSVQQLAGLHLVVENAQIYELKTGAWPSSIISRAINRYIYFESER